MEYMTFTNRVSQFVHTTKGHTLPLKLYTLGTRARDTGKEQQLIPENLYYC